METKKYTQYGKFSILILVPMILLFLGWWIKYRFSEHERVMFPLYISMLSVVLLLLFYQLTIIIDETHLSFKMGIGLIRRSFRISDIKSCRPVTNYFLTGFGIRLIRNGWLYNVSGFKAIELSFHHKNSVIRIGTDCPEKICEALSRLKGNNHLEEPSPADLHPRSLTPRFILLAIILVLFGAFLFSVRKEKEVTVDKNQITIKGLYGISIPLTDINEVDTLTFLPAIRMKTNGYADGKTLVGYFKMEDETKAKLFIKNRQPPFLRIISRNHIPVYINFEKREKTVNVYNKLMDALEK